MKTRRPLAHLTLAYAFGIGSAYLFSPDRRLYFLIAAAGLAFLFPGAVRFAKAASGRKMLDRTRGVCRPVRRTQRYSFVSRQMAAAMFFVFAAGGIYCDAALIRTDPLTPYAVSPYNNVGEDARHAGAMPVQTGRVIKINVMNDDGNKITVSSGGRNILLRVTGGTITPAELLGRKISFAGTVELPQGRRNPGCFDYRLYLMTQDVRVIVKCKADDVELCASGGSSGSRQIGVRADGEKTSRFRPDPAGDLYNVLGRLKYGFLDRARASMRPQSFALFAGMLFGDTSDMEETMYEMFQTNGVAHILSVSGIHVAIVYGFFNVLFGGRRSVPVCLCILICLFVYALLSEFSPSVVRAVVMIGFHILAKLVAKRYDLLTGICAAALIILLFNPLQLFGVGFQLSFLAVFLLAFAIPFANRFVGFRDARTGAKLSKPELIVRGKGSFPARIGEKAVQTFIPLLAIQIGMAPMIAYTFNYVALSGAALNVPVVAVSGFVIPLGILMIPVAGLAGLAVPFVSGFASSLFAALARLAAILLDAVTRLTEFADGLPFSHFRTVSPHAQWILLFYGALFFCLSETFGILLARRLPKQVFCFFAGLAILVAFTLTSPVCVRGAGELVFLDVGQGDCLYIRTPDGRNYLVDGGGQTEYDVGKNVLLPFLLKNGVRKLDGVFVTHLHTDHYKGLRELSKCIPAERLFLYDGNRLRTDFVIEDSSFKSKDLFFLSRGDRVGMGRDVSLTVLYPPKGSVGQYERTLAGDEDENRTSLLMLLDYGGVTVLMTGDMGEEGETAAL
ncbi:MAG: ComEC/Rec2 family competence protein, partial [Clostridiales Family XIII bacterium]|nr:ComEC/Rec2 family competence protein [Clostridiales Family XIII bacterium]